MLTNRVSLQGSNNVIRKTSPMSVLFAASMMFNVLYPGHALAQQRATAGSDQLQEIVVTATKRETTVQETPISITAISGADIEARGYADFDSIAKSVPGLSMQTGGPGQTGYEMRGMSSSGGASPTVGFYLDDIPLTGVADLPLGKIVIDPNLYDLNRVEILPVRRALCMDLARWRHDQDRTERPECWGVYCVRGVNSLLY